MNASGASKTDAGKEVATPHKGRADLAPLFLEALLRQVVALVGATAAAGFAVDVAEGRPVLRELSHLRPPTDPDLRAAALSGFRKMAQRCLDTGKRRAAFGIGGAYAGPGMKFCLVHILSDATGPRAAVAVVTRCKDREDVKRRLGILCGTA